MRRLLTLVSFSVCGLILAGCATPPRSGHRPVCSDRDIPAQPDIVRVGYAPDDGAAEALYTPREITEEKVVPESVDLPYLIGLTLERNPRLAQAGWAVETARGGAIQAGLYPNPTLNLTGNEIADRTGRVGILTVYASQELVTAEKLELSQAVASKEIDRATLEVVAERYEVLTDIRRAYFHAVALQRREQILEELVELAEKSTANAEKLLRAKEAAELDVIQLEVDLEGYRTELASTRSELPAAYRRLAASAGLQALPVSRVSDDLDLPLPEYELDKLRDYVLSLHPKLRSAKVGVERAKLSLQREQAEATPNVTVGAGYTYQGQNRSNDFDLGVSFPIPIRNQNQGNILAAQARVSEAINYVGRVQNDLVEQLASAYADYASARERSQRYATVLLPKTQRTYELALKAYQGGQFEYLRVLQAQRTLAETKLKRVEAQAEMWQAASVLAGLMLED